VIGTGGRDGGNGGKHTSKRFTLVKVIGFISAPWLKAFIAQPLSPDMGVDRPILEVVSLTYGLKKNFPSATLRERVKQL